MEDRETPRIHKYGESKTTRIMMATVWHVTSVAVACFLPGRAKDLSAPLYLKI